MICSIIIIISVTFTLLSKFISANSKSESEIIDILLSLHWLSPSIYKSMKSESSFLILIDFILLCFFFIEFDPFSNSYFLLLGKPKNI